MLLLSTYPSGLIKKYHNVSTDEEYQYLGCEPTAVFVFYSDSQQINHLINLDWISNLFWILEAHFDRMTPNLTEMASELQLFLY